MQTVTVNPSALPKVTPGHKRFRVQVKIETIGVVADVVINCPQIGHSAGKCDFTPEKATRYATPIVTFVPEAI